MCGIAGLINKKGRCDGSVVDAMLCRIRHRGPDDCGVLGWNDNDIYPETLASNIHEYVNGILGFNRLSIRDLTTAGHQPMVSDDNKIVITFNGEIYNTEELIQKLSDKGVKHYHGTSDTEIVLKCYELFGNETWHMLNGMFAIVLLDLKRHRVLAVRDKWGIVPLHIMENSKVFAWCSEMKGFLDIPSFGREVNESSLSQAYLYYNPVSPIYKGVYDVTPGTYLEIDYEGNNFSVTSNVYFSINEYMNIKKYSCFEECLEEYQEVLKDCVRRQMISDVPLGVQLSGGVDSTSIAYWASKFSGQGERIKSISLIHTNDDANNEKQWIEYVIGKLDVEPRYAYANNELFIDYFEKTLYAYERLLGIQNGMAIYHFSKIISDELTVLLSGEGADEICGGYGQAAIAYANQNVFTDEFLWNFDRQISHYENGMKMLSCFKLEEVATERRKYIDSLEGMTHQKIAALWMKEELVCLLERQNKVTMANSVENRVPFLDDRMVKFAMSLPLEYVEHKNAKSEYDTKYVIKRANALYYDDNFSFRKKQGMGFTISKQLNNRRFIEYINEILIPGMKNRGLINMTYFNQRYSRLVNGQDVYSVWKALCIEAWYQLFVDGREPI